MEKTARQQSHLHVVEMAQIDSILDTENNKQTIYVTQEQQYRYLIYDIIKNKVNLIFASYSK